MDQNHVMKKATFAGGCFWCTEAVFRQLDGVASVKSGYIGGKTENPTYKEVCEGTTGHAEAVEIEYDPAKIDYGTLLQIFFDTHDPTTLNRQGNDVGTQYRSEIFYHDLDQRDQAQEKITDLNMANPYGGRVVTHLSPASIFYPAEEYHDDYYARNPNAGYCAFVIKPKVDKVHSKFTEFTR